MTGLPDFLKVPEGLQRLFLPSASLPVSDLIKFELPPQRKSTVFADPSDYLSDLALTVTAVDVLRIPVPPSVVVKALGRAILLDPKMKSIVLVHSPAHRDEKQYYPLWLATIAVDQVHTTLEKSTTTEAATARAKAALQVLDKLSWDGIVKGFKGSPTVDSLALWFTTDWLKTDHEDSMLELLAGDLGLDDGSTSAMETT